MSERREFAHDRRFGFTLSGVLFVLWSVSNFLFDSADHGYLVVAIVFFGCALFVPWLLVPLERIARMIVYRVIALFSQSVLALAFFCIVTPFGFVMRSLTGSRLGMATRPGAKSYWQKSTRAEQSIESMLDMF